MWSDACRPRKPEIPTQTPGISAIRDRAQAFVQRLVMQTVLDVLERQGRSALLPDSVISAILSQLTVNINYEPLRCETVINSPMDNAVELQLMHPNCIIIGNTVMGICTPKADKDKCMKDQMVSAVPANHTSISGAFSTTNIIMANWSRTMWQNVANRAVRILASGPFQSHFFAASATVGGN
ncbi:hypothetical protein KIN20_035924 [Parelaphostrongylus tenuis]|uniref:Uncharacterized protein n=1 Tax=Parelaphostrongylus tenuis TaxID=148309 RepID=A0AAD5RBW6_PARTN|nr:hypothetical protein KIN20_035924 [Parelaphostrongylus tenuis]